MSLATELLPTIRDVLNEFGSSITLNKYTQSYVDGSMVDVILSATDLKASIGSYSSEEIKGSVQVGDVKIMLAFSGDIDIAKDKVSFMNDEYQIVNSMPLVFQDVIMVYELHVRK